MSDETVERFIQQQYTVLVGLGRPENVEGLMRIASVFARRQKGRIIAVSIVPVPPEADLEQGAEYAEPERLALAEEVVQQAEAFGAELGIAVEPSVQFAHDVATGIASACRDADVEMVLLGHSPPERETEEDEDVSTRITERVADMAGPSLAIVELPEGDATPRMLIPLTEELDPEVIEDLVRTVALFGGARLTVIGLLPRGLDEAAFTQRSGALREALDEMDFEDVQEIDLDAREAASCLFGAEARQIAGGSHQAAFIIRANV